MATKTQKYLKVRFPKTDRGNEGMLLENLRYAGLVGLQNPFIPESPEDEDFIIFEMYPPGYIKTKEQQTTWTEMNQKRMASFMIKAEIKERTIS